MQPKVIYEEHKWLLSFFIFIAFIFDARHDQQIIREWPIIMFGKWFFFFKFATFPLFFYENVLDGHVFKTPCQEFQLLHTAQQWTNQKTPEPGQVSMATVVFDGNRAEEAFWLCFFFYIFLHSWVLLLAFLRHKDAFCVNGPLAFFFHLLPS